MTSAAWRRGQNVGMNRGGSKTGARFELAALAGGNRLSEKIMREQKHDPEKWKPVFGKDHARTKA
jgi:hypothetical protein